MWVLYVIATQPLAQPLSHFAILRDQKRPQRPFSNAGYSLFGKLINFLLHQFLKLLVIFGTF